MGGKGSQADKSQTAHGLWPLFDGSSIDKLCELCEDRAANEVDTLILRARGMD
jgi:hypothetical protein